MTETNHRVFQMTFSSVYRALVAKAERKGRTAAEVNHIISWLTGYSSDTLAQLEQTDLTYKSFFDQAPAVNPARTLITGNICGVRIEEIDDPTMAIIRQLDKLVDELAKGKPVDKILRQLDEADLGQK